MDQPTLPLTGPQKIRLLVLCLPFPCFGAALVFYYAFWVDFASRWSRQPIDLASGKSLLFLALMALVLAVTGLQALRALRDLASGAALVTEDRLLRSWRSRGSYRRAKFAKLGRMRILRWAGSDGQTYRIVYSPATKIVWSADLS
ncbi:MAG TPA: hypothetical protein VJR89_10245 [Polyangiales bacterium]|nr:hypothetical protein [Polyangiales bacterium]